MNDIEKNVQRDPFRQLREIADQDKLAERLQQYLGPAFASGEKQIEDCKIEQLHYTSGVDCQIIFTAKIRHHDQREISQGIFFGTHLRLRYPGALAACTSLKHSPGTQPPFGSAMIYIPEWEMLLWAYPSDSATSHSLV